MLGFRSLMLLLLAAPAIASAGAGSFEASQPMGVISGASWRLEASWESDRLDVTFTPDVTNQKINGWTTLGGSFAFQHDGGGPITEPFYLKLRLKASFVETATGQLIDPLLLGYSNNYSPTWRLTWWTVIGATPSVGGAGGMLNSSLTLTDSNGVVTTGELRVCERVIDCPGASSQTLDYSLSFDPGDAGVAYPSGLTSRWTVVAGVPEPATWASLGAGLLMVGALARRRRT